MQTYSNLNIFYQDIDFMSFSDEDVSEERIKRSANDWRTKYPIASAIFDKIPTMELGEVVGTMYLVDVVKRLVKMRALRLSVEEGKEPLDLLEDKLSDQKVEEKINGLKKSYPTAGDILERIHHMDLKEATMAMFALDSMESLLKAKAALILLS
jgi:hypothetical protein